MLMKTSFFLSVKCFTKAVWVVSRNLHLKCLLKFEIFLRSFMNTVFMVNLTYYLVDIVTLWLRTTNLYDVIESGSRKFHINVCICTPETIQDQLLQMAQIQVKIYVNVCMSIADRQSHPCINMVQSHEHLMSLRQYMYFNNFLRPSLLLAGEDSIIVQELRALTTGQSY